MDRLGALSTLAAASLSALGKSSVVGALLGPAVTEAGLAASAANLLDKSKNGTATVADYLDLASTLASIASLAIPVARPIGIGLAALSLLLSRGKR